MATTRDYTNSLLDAKIVLRNDTAANWKMANPILLEGEFAVELDTKKFKLGDGTTPWNSLKYLDFGGSSGGDLEPRVETLESEMTEAQGNIYVLSTQMVEALKAAADAAEAKKLAEETNEKVDGFDQRITDAETNAKAALDKATEVESSVGQYDERITKASEDASEAKTTAQEAVVKADEAKSTADAVASTAQDALDKATTASDKVDLLETQMESTVKYTEFQNPNDPEPRKTIQLNNHDTISGLTTSGEGVNIAMVSKWDKVDLGSPQVELNLNGSAERPTYNDNKELALVSDVQEVSEKLDSLDSSAVKYKEFQNANDDQVRKTIELKNHDTISGLMPDGTGVNIAMVSKWGKVDLGSASAEINLNGPADKRPTYNDTEEIALVKDIPSSENFATKEELNTLSGTVSGFDSRITEAESKAEEASSSVAQYDQKIQDATDLATSASNTASQTADGLQELKTTVNNQETRIIALENKGYDGGDVEL